MNVTDIIKGPLITEKLDKAREKLQQYSFIVDRKATKHDVSRAVSSLFKVNVEGAPQLSRRFSVQASPTLLVMERGRLLASRCGSAPAYKILGWVEQVLIRKHGTARVLPNEGSDATGAAARDDG